MFAAYRHPTETSMPAEARAAHPDGGRITAAAVVATVCLDHVACAECDRILGNPFRPIDARPPSPRRASTSGSTSASGSGSGSAPVPMARVGVGLGTGPGTGGDGARAEGSDATISGMAERLGLEAAVGERAEEVFWKMEEARAWPRGPGWAKGRSRRDKSRLYAACLSIACRNEGSPRSLRELALATADGGAKARKEIAKLTAHIRKRLGEEEAGQATGVGVVPVSDYVRRFGPLLGLGEPEAAAALEAARRLDEGALDVRHNSASVAAAVLCVALERAGAREHVADVVTVTGVTHLTIDTVCRKLRPHAALLFD